MSSLPQDIEQRNKSLPPPWDRIFSLVTRFFVWGLLLAVLYVLRPFFLLVFLTFVFAYVQSHGVDGLAHRFARRTPRVVLVGLVFLGTILATGLFLFPRIQQQAEVFIKKVPVYLRDADAAIQEEIRTRAWVARLFGRQPPPEKGAADNGENPTPSTGDIPDEEGKDQGEQGGAGEQGKQGAAEQGKQGVGEQGKQGAAEQGKQGAAEQGKQGVGEQGKQGAAEQGKQGAAEQGKQGGGEQAQQKPKQPEEGSLQNGVASDEQIVTKVVSELIGFATPDDAGANPDEVLRKRIHTVTELSTSVIGIASSFLLSLLFSFLIVLDLPQITRGIKSLSKTKIGFIYNEVADNIHSFGMVLGRALEAQLFIAIVNTILTAIGLYFMGLPNLVFLSAIVFLCSFIPVAGVFISSAPICLVSLQAGGFSLMFVAVGLILVIHTIEAYVLNPKIFGHHLRMNPVLVLIVLTVGGKLFGVWGLVLGLPIVNYVFRHAIRYKGDEDMEATAVEPAPAPPGPPSA